MPRSSFEPFHNGFGNPVSVVIRRLWSCYAFGSILIGLTLAKTAYPAEPHQLVLADERQDSVSKTIRIQPLMQTSTLGDAAITSILRDDSGYLWIAEQSGLHLHDGRNLHSFKTISPGSYYAPSLNITSIIQDINGVIWASSSSTGITRYDAKKQVFENVHALPGSNVSQLAFISPDTLLYIHDGTLKGYRVSARSHVLELDKHAEAFGAVSRVLLLHDSIIAVSSELGIFRLDLNRNSMNRISPLALNVSDEPTKRKTEQIDGKASGRLHEGAAVRILQSDDDEGDRKLRESTVTTITAVHRGLFFAGTDSGLYVFRMDGSFIQKYDARNSGLTNSHITHLHSTEDTLWIGTYEGVCHLKISDFETYNYRSDSISNEILNFSQDMSGRVWIGTYDGIYVFNPIDLSHKHFSDLFAHISLVDRRIMALDVTYSEAFIGTRASGLLILDLNSGDTIKHNIYGNRDLEVTQILRLSDTVVLVSSFNSGVYLLEKTSRNEKIKYEATQLTDSPITILRRNASKVLAANEREIYVYDITSKKFSAVDFEFPLQRIQPVVTAIRPMPGDSVLIGTQSHGIFLVGLGNTGRSPSQVESNFQEVHNYAASVYAIEEDSQDRLWIATSNGLFLYSSDFRFLRRYSAKDGIQGNKFNFGSSFIDKDSNIYFGGSRGYSKFLPSLISASTNPPAIRTTMVDIYGNEGSSVLWNETPDSIVLNHTDRFITFEFSALDFTDPESTRYRHKLVGFDKDWVDVGNRGSATYTNLPAGDYIFRVQAVNSAGIWNYDGLTIDLRVAPAPWLTWWAFSAYFILFLGAASLFLKFYRNYMLKEQQLQQANEMQRVADRFADELQDQIDFQSKLTDSIHSYNKQLLYWAGFCTDTTLEYEPGATELAHKRVRFRLEVLDVVQDSLYYQGERLYANLHDCADRLANALCSRHPHLCNRLTVVNDIQQELVPAAQAIPIAIILAELFDNSLTHGFDAERSSCFVRFSVTYTPSPGANSDTARFIYQDNGIGIPPGLAFESPEAAGFAIIKRAGEVLGCELAIGREDRSMVTASFLLPWS